MENEIITVQYGRRYYVLRDCLNRYGSLEIKRAYRKNMTIGIMMAAIILITGV
jgi:hypothetical protein